MPLKPRPARLLSLVCLVCTLVLPTTARADELLTKQQCVDASESAISLREGGHLRAAREQLVRCGRDECPAILKEDCATNLRAVDGRIPTVVFSVRDDAGRDVLDSSILVDDETGDGSPIDGRARPFDPGRHDVRVRRDGAVVATEPVVLREGEQNRVVFVMIRREAPAETNAPKRAEVVQRSKAFPVLPIVLAGVGVLGLGAAGAISLHLDSRIDDLKGSCGPGCSVSDRAGLSSELVAANVSLIGGIISLAAAGVTWFLLKPRSEDGPASRQIAITSGR